MLKNDDNFFESYENKIDNKNHDNQNSSSRGIENALSNLSNKDEPKNMNKKICDNLTLINDWIYLIGKKEIPNQNENNQINAKTENMDGFLSSLDSKNSDHEYNFFDDFMKNNEEISGFSGLSSIKYSETNSEINSNRIQNNNTYFQRKNNNICLESNRPKSSPYPDESQIHI